VTARRLAPIAIAAAAAAFVAILGSTVTDLGPWYQGLAKPSWQPPDPAFGLIWTIVFTLTAASGAIAWRHAPRGRARETLIGAFALNGFLNVLWSLMFFRLQRPDWALWEIAPFWLSIAGLIVLAGRHRALAGALLVPYLVWVSVAAALNVEIVRLNGPF
jgi:tryptophan-rich sensory protein